MLKGSGRRSQRAPVTPSSHGVNGERAQVQMLPGPIEAVASRRCPRRVVSLRLLGFSLVRYRMGSPDQKGGVTM